MLTEYRVYDAEIESLDKAMGYTASSPSAAALAHARYLYDQEPFDLCDIRVFEGPVQVGQFQIAVSHEPIFEVVEV